MSQAGRCGSILGATNVSSVITGQGVGEFAKYLLPLLNAHQELMAKVTWMPAFNEGQR